MRWMTGGVAVLLALLAASAVKISAQDGPRGLRGPGPDGRVGGVEAIMRIADRLELSDEQLGSLDALRQSRVEAQNDRFAARNRLQSQFRAGQIERSEFNEAMRTQREAIVDLAGQEREQIESILTEAQLESINQERDRARAFARGRASMRGERSRMRGGRGIRGNRGGFPGRRGFRPGFPG